MDHIFQAMFPYLMTAFGVISLIMLKALLKTHSTNTIEIASLRKDFNSLLLNLANLTPTFMSVDLCGKVRDGCVQLNKKIILDPLQRQFDIHSKDNEDEFEQVWSSLKNHLHSTDGVIVSPRKGQL